MTTTTPTIYHSAAYRAMSLRMMASQAGSPDVWGDRATRRYLVNMQRGYRLSAEARA